jgi:hypothetical protein
MRRIYPLLFQQKVQSKPSTLKRFDSIMTAIGLFVSLFGWSFASQLSQLLQLAYNRIVSLSFGDATELSNNLKRARITYFNYMRGGVAFANMISKESNQPGFDAVLAGRNVSEVSALNRIMEFRDNLLATSVPLQDIIQFDRIVIALLSLDRVMAFSAPLSFETITDKGTVFPDKDGKAFFSNMVDLLASLGITRSDFKAEYKRRCKQHHHFIISTSGPNGPATWTAHSDAKALLGNTALYQSFQVLATESGMPWLVNDLLGVVSLPSYDSMPDSLIYTGRLHDFEEWGGKRRVVAIVDYWTQTLLTPLHDTIFHFLAKIEADGTFNQDAASERVRSFTAQSGAQVYSYDLTAATDRLPIWIQEEILEWLLGRSIAKHWSRLLTAREYFHRDTNKGYKYAVGQPMGAKSSWAMLALTHHIILKAAALKASTETYNDYAILGDDIVLTGSAVATNYTSIMNSLGVKINLFKSITHYADTIPAAEFAKRIFMNGVEYTTFPVKLIAKTIMNGRLAPQLQNELSRRGMDTSRRQCLEFLVGLVDKDSAQFLTILNALPTSLSSLIAACKPGGRLGDMATWYGDRYTPTEFDLKQAFLFTAVTEQLKRLDTLLRQAQTIASAIEMNAFGYATIAPDSLGWDYEDPEIDLKALAASMPKLTIGHPIVRAAQIEADRLGALLADLRHGDIAVTLKAQTKVLDMFRSSLVDTWADSEAARAQADRTLLQRSLTLLSDIIMNRLGNNEGQRPHFVDFTINLAFLNRLWTVSWELGKAMEINSVRSRVLADSVAAADRLVTVEAETSIMDMYTPAPRRSRQYTPRVVSPTDQGAKAGRAVIHGPQPISRV